MRWMVLSIGVLLLGCEASYQQVQGGFAVWDVEALSGLHVEKCLAEGRTRVMVCQVGWTEKEVAGVRERLRLSDLPGGMRAECGGEVTEWWGATGRPVMLRELKTGASGERFGIGKKKAGGYCVVLEYSYG